MLLTFKGSVCPSSSTTTILNSWEHRAFLHLSVMVVVVLVINKMVFAIGINTLVANFKAISLHTRTTSNIKLLARLICPNLESSLLLMSMGKVYMFPCRAFCTQDSTVTAVLLLFKMFPHQTSSWVQCSGNNLPPLLTTILQLILLIWLSS